MTNTELRKITEGRFTKVAENENSVIVGTLGSLDSDNTTQEIVVYIAQFYNIETSADKFGYHFIIADGAKKKGCKLPTRNYNQFIEIFK